MGWAEYIVISVLASASIATCYFIYRIKTQQKRAFKEMNKNIEKWLETIEKDVRKQINERMSNEKTSCTDPKRNHPLANDSSEQGD